MFNIKTWEERASEIVDSGSIEKSIKQELFNQAWKTTSKIVIDKLKIVEADYVLDAGCGWGRLLVGIKYHFPSIKIDGIELTEKFVEVARDLLKDLEINDNSKVIQGNLVESDLGQDKYNKFYSTRVLHYIDKKELVLKKLYNCLKKEGKGIIIIPNRFSPYRLLTYKHAPLYSIFRVKEHMKNVGFKKVKTGGYGFIPDLSHFKFKSNLSFIEEISNKIPLANYLGGLAYAIGEK